MELSDGLKDVGEGGFRRCGHGVSRYKEARYLVVLDFVNRGYNQKTN